MKAVKILLVVLVVLAACVGGFYWYISSPKTVDTKYTDADYTSVVEKSGVQELLLVNEKDKVGLTELLSGNFTDTGAKHLENVTVTAPEVAAFVNKAVKTDVINNFNIAFHDGYIAMSFNIGTNIQAIVDTFPQAAPYTKYMKLAAGKPVYWELTLERATDKSFTSTTRALYIGKLELPQEQLDKALSTLGSEANKVVADFDNFEVDALSISEDGLTFSGTIPQAVNLR